MLQALLLRTYVHISVRSDMRLACIGFVLGRCSFQATDIPGAAALLNEIQLLNELFQAASVRSAEGHCVDLICTS